MDTSIYTWNNGDSGKTVKEVIDKNFKNFDERIRQTVERTVFYFSASDWADGIIFISYSQYNKPNPCVDVYIKNGTGYSLVYDGYEIRDTGIELQSDMAYEGKVVIR